MKRAFELRHFPIWSAAIVAAALFAALALSAVTAEAQTATPTGTATASPTGTASPTTTASPTATVGPPSTGTGGFADSDHGNMSLTLALLGGGAVAVAGGAWVLMRRAR